MNHISITYDDICLVKADAIVNAANKTLEGGGGVDGAIHRECGPELLYECRKFPIMNHGRCDTGEVKVTKSYDLQTCKYIFHTVAPITLHSDKCSSNHDALKLCYKNCLVTATEMNLKSIAFCCLGTGAYGFPKNEAAKIAVDIAKKYPNIKIIFSLFEETDRKIYEEILGI